MIRTVPASLRRARELARPALEEAVGRLGPEIRGVVAYHLGWADAEGNPMESDGGKAVRPALALLSAEAAGARAEVGLPGAVAVELVHNFSLLHDDVMDRDRERRHRPTAWTQFGEGRAIVSGDALLALAQEVLLEAPSAARHAAARSLARATSLMCLGQAEDLSFESRSDVTLEECRAMSARKTGALLSCAAEIGAVLAGAPQDLVEALRRFGLHLGLAFQAVDDLLGIWGRPEATGKPAWSDLRQHKKTLPVVAVLESGGSAPLRDILSNGHLPEAEVARAARLVEENGGRRLTEEEAERQLAAALAALEEGAAADGAAGELRELARFVVAREF